MTQSSDDDTITISIGDYTFSDSNDLSTITTSDTTLGYDLSEYTVDTIDISSITTSTVDSNLTITLDDTHWADEITWEKTEFEDKMPSVAKVEDMCKDYPALEQAYEKFKTIYAMVHQDWKGKQDDMLPF